MQQYKAEDGRYKVSEFLQDNNIEIITKDNYKSKVYGSKKPVIVMPYTPIEYVKTHGISNDKSMREATILNFLKEQFGDKIECYAFSVEDDETRHLFAVEIGKFIANYSAKYPVFKEEGDVPSLLAYGIQDGPKKLDKKQMIDAVRGGPESAEELFEMYSDMSKFWIWNVLDNGKHHILKKSYNTYKWIEVKN